MEDYMNYAITVKFPTPTEVITGEEEKISSKNPQSETIQWYFCLEKCSFNKLRLLSEMIILRRRLLTVKPTKCAGYLYDFMTRCPWTTKSPKNDRKLQQVMVRGDCIFMN